MADSEVRVEAEKLRRFTTEVFTRVGLPPEDAATEAELLIWANLRGVDSHGVLHVQRYVAAVEAGGMNPSPDIQIVNETPATVLIDADRAFGPVVTTMAMKMVIKKAREVGIGWGLIRNHTHQGAMGYYPLMAAKEGMVGMAVVAGAPEMAVHGARVEGPSNSPIAIAVPGKRHEPLILDMATSVAAGGKVRVALDKGISIPEGWSLDKDGNPTTDPSQSAVLVPLGGPQGSGLAIMFECLSSLMVGNPLVSPVLMGEGKVPRIVQNSFIVAIDICTFTDVEAYKEDVDKLIDSLKALPKAKGVDEIFVPGELEGRTYRDRVQNGIPLPEGTARSLQAIAERFEIDLPFLLS